MSNTSQAAKLLGNRIRTIRTVRGISQEELAFKSSISPAHLGQIERAVKNPTVDTVYKIASALELPMQALFDLEFPSQKPENNVTINKILAYLADMTENQQRDILKVVKTFQHFRDNK